MQWVKEESSPLNFIFVFQSSRPHRKFELAPTKCHGSRVETEVGLNKESVKSLALRSLRGTATSEHFGVLASVHTVRENGQVDFITGAY